MKKFIKYIIGILLILSSVLLIGDSEYKVIKVLMDRDNLNNEINEVKSTVVDKNNNNKLINITAELNGAIGSLQDNTDTVNEICEVQMLQTSNIYESQKLSKKLYQMMDEDLKI